MILTRQTRSAAQTHALGVTLGRVLRAGDVLLLDGDLGAGKTVLVRGIAEGMGIDAARVSSPTFVLVHEYPGPAGGTRLVHVDAYRLGAGDEATLGLDALRRDSATVIEWGDRYSGAPGRAARARIEVVSPECRRVCLTLPAEWASRPDFSALA